MMQTLAFINKVTKDFKPWTTAKIAIINYICFNTF